MPRGRESMHCRYYIRNGSGRPEFDARIHVGFSTA